MSVFSFFVQFFYYTSGIAPVQERTARIGVQNGTECLTFSPPPGYNFGRLRRAERRFKRSSDRTRPVKGEMEE